MPGQKQQGAYQLLQLGLPSTVRAVAGRLTSCGSIRNLVGQDRGSDCTLEWLELLPCVENRYENGTSRRVIGNQDRGGDVVPVDWGLQSLGVPGLCRKKECESCETGTTPRKQRDALCAAL